MGIRPCRLVAIIIPLSLISFSCSNDSVNNINRPPAEPSNPVPPDGASGVELDALLSWQCTEPDGDALRYNLYFDTDSDPSLVALNLGEDSYPLDSLQYGQTYFWKIAAFDDHGHESSSSLWHFTTRRELGIYLIGSCGLEEFSSLQYGFDVSGGYAYLAGPEATLWVYDVNDPSDPTLTSAFDTGLRAHDVFIQGDFAYLTTGDSTLQVLYIAEPQNPEWVGACELPSISGPIFVQGPYAYVTGYDFIAVDVSNRTDPTVISHGVYYNLYTRLSVSGNYAYTAHFLDIYEYRFDVFDITDPESPELISSTGHFYSAWDVEYTDNYAYISAGPAGGHLRVFDVSDPFNPCLIFDPAEGFYFVDLSVSAGYLFGAGSYNLKALDISNPHYPAIIAEYTSESPCKLIDVEGDYIYVVDGSPALLIFEFEP